jgi:Protein of unknown function (DUF2511)
MLAADSRVRAEGRFVPRGPAATVKCQTVAGRRSRSARTSSCGETSSFGLWGARLRGDSQTVGILAKQTCPYCAEQIQDAAIVCRFCNRNQPLGGDDPTQSTTNLSPYEQQQQATRQQPRSPLYDRRLHKTLLGVAAVIVLLWLLPSAPPRRADVAATPDTREVGSSARSDGFIARAEFGDAWPFTVDSGVLSCDNGAIIFTSGAVAYGVNGLAKSRGYRRIEEIWNWRDGIVARMDLTPIFERGQQRCR